MSLLLFLRDELHGRTDLPPSGQNCVSADLQALGGRQILSVRAERLTFAESGGYGLSIHAVHRQEQPPGRVARALLETMIATTSDRFQA